MDVSKHFSKEGIMTSKFQSVGLFEYQEIICSLQLKTRSILIKMRHQYLTQLALEEMIDLFQWCQEHIEVKSIHLSSIHPHFSLGIEKEKLKNADKNELTLFTKTLQQCVSLMQSMPQTIIVDIKNGTFNFASELILGADIRLIRDLGSVQFDHLKLGLFPVLSNNLSLLVGARAKNWIMSSKPILTEELIHSGFVMDLIKEDADVAKIQQDISQQSDINRIQTKKYFNAQDVELKHSDLISAKDVYRFEDWKKEKFMTAREARDMISGGH